MFTNETNGYNKKEVDKKINALLLELSNLKQSVIEKDKLNIGLASALEKAKQIDLSSRNIYELKIQKIMILYKSLEKGFKNLFKLYPQIEEFDDIKETFDDFSRSVEVGVMPDRKNIITSPVSTENDTMRLLLNKMSSYAQPGQQTSFLPEKKTISIKRNDTKTTITEKQSLIKPIFEIKTTKKDPNATPDVCPADKFLESGEATSKVYEKIINTKVDDDLFPTPNESGFDLKEAVNPKDNLSEIMKSFNFDEE